MSKENLLVCALGSYETMANVTVICTDKTGTLTQTKTSVVASTIGVQAKFVRKPEENDNSASNDDGGGPNTKDLVDLANLNTDLPRPVMDLLNAAIVINSTAFEDVDPESGDESASLGFAKELGWPNYEDTRNSANIVHMIPFSSDRKYMACVVRLRGGSHRLYAKGASEILARNCARHVITTSFNAAEIETAPIREPEEDNISQAITLYASQTLRTIALCYRDFPSWPPKGVRFLDNDEASKCITVPVFDD